MIDPSIIWGRAKMTSVLGLGPRPSGRKTAGNHRGLAALPMSDNDRYF